MATKKIIEVDVVNSLSDSDTIFVNSDNSLKQISKSNLVIKGDTGKSAYQYAQEGGYTGTEAEFSARMAAEIPTVDSTLAKSGQAADAAVVGNRLSALSEEIAGLQGALGSYITDVAELVGGDA